MKAKEPSQTQERIYERLAQLDEETQERISRKYYHGTRPWLPRKEGTAARRRRRKAGQTQEND